MKWVVLTVVVAALGLYIWYLISEASSRIVKAPQDEAFICPVHGMIPKATLVNINTGVLGLPEGMEWEYDGEMTTGTIPYCPLCFEDRTKEAKARYGK
jgi:hypothetical protein